jgi:hypothetical protein
VLNCTIDEMSLPDIYSRVAEYTFFAAVMKLSLK